MSKKDKDSFLKRAFVTRTHGYIDVAQKREVWEQIALEFSGELKISHNSSRELEIHKLSIPYKKWNILISESDTKPLKIEIEFRSVFDYNLLLGWEDSIDKILKKIGKQEIEIGNEIFDNRYFIKSNDADKTKNIFTEEIMNLMLKYNVYAVSYTTDSKKQKSNLMSVISRNIDSKDMIKDLILLHFNFIDSLERMHIIK